MRLIWPVLQLQTVNLLQLLQSSTTATRSTSRSNFIFKSVISLVPVPRAITMADERTHHCYGGSSGIDNFRTQKMAQRAVPLLNWLIPLGAIASVINVTVSMCTGEWLKSYERIPMDTPGSLNKDEFRVKRTVSGLWSLCYANSTEELEMHCFTIDYFAKDRYTPEPHDSTMAIPYTVTKAGPLFIVASIFLGIAILFATLGFIWRSKRIATFIAGIIFIIAGLIMLIGIVVYLSVLQSEIGTKLRARNALDAALFKYSYGYGFILIVIGFMFTELTGTCAIFWYIYWHQLDWAQKEGYHNGDIGVARPLCKGMESDCNFTSSSAGNNAHYSASNNVGWHVVGGNHRNSSSNHRNHHHQGRGETDSRGFSRGNELNSYYTYSAVGDGGNSVYCKKHGQRQPQQQLPCYCGNNSSSKKYRHSKHHYHGSHNHLSGPNSSNHFYHHYGDYDDDVDNILEVPFPPPPPNRPIPRDITCTTTVSGGDDFYGNNAVVAPAHDPHVHHNPSQQQQHGGVRDSRDLRKTTPV